VAERFLKLSIALLLAVALAWGYCANCLPDPPPPPSHHGDCCDSSKNCPKPAVDDCAQNSPAYETVSKVEIQPSPAVVETISTFSPVVATALHETPVDLRGSPPLDLPLLNSSLLI